MKANGSTLQRPHQISYLTVSLLATRVKCDMRAAQTSCTFHTAVHSKGAQPETTHQISNFTVSPLATQVECDMKAAPMVTLELGSNAPRTYRNTRHDLPTPCMRCGKERF